MSNNSEYTKEYIDTVEEWFRTYDRVIHTPAMDKSLSYQKVLEFGSIHGEVEKFKEYLLDNVSSASYYAEQVDVLENVEIEYEAVKKALLKLKVQLDTFQHSLDDNDQEEYSKWIDMIDEMAEGEIPEELKDKLKKKVKK